jgi:hypothetical protein
VTIEILLVLCIVAQRALRFLEERHHREEQAAWRLERASLLQRIQAPQVAVYQHDVPEEAENPRAVSPDSDRDYWDAADDVLKQMARIEREAK